MNQSELKNQVINDHDFYRNKLRDLEGMRLGSEIDLHYFGIPIEIKETRQLAKQQPNRKFLVKKKDMNCRWFLFITNKTYIYAVQKDYVQLSSNIDSVKCEYVGFYLSLVRQFAMFKGRNIEKILQEILWYENSIKKRFNNGKKAI